MKLYRFLDLFTTDTANMCQKAQSVEIPRDTHDIPVSRVPIKFSRTGRAIEVSIYVT